MIRTGFLLPSIVFAAWFAVGAAAAPIAYDGFDYAPGPLVGESGGTGDWKSSWSGDSDVEVLTGGMSYVDSKGNSMSVTGNRIGLTSGSITKKAERQLNDKVGSATETVWASFLLDGSSGSAVNNVSLGDGLFVGQGGKDSGSTNILLSDQDGLVADTGVSAATQLFLVVRIDFQAGDEDVWLWTDPDLDAEPDTGTAIASGTLKDFETDFVRAQLSNTAGAIDELRFGFGWFDVLQESPEPVTALLVGLGLIGLSAHSRRRRVGGS
ncbi:MAG: PEP-CTERM sorting domain-containing protein [Deltaproteobacteria bacterium]|nr:PEP-CTERM sorting domain-containing protein [Deltaproteobacteria bacterium]MBW2362828.1 PEP-CTERM sorting domain-containing protein [Deltaproteobacteria bacterium]